MDLPLVIGRNSSGENFIIDLESLPHLLISYHEEIQLYQAFVRLVNDFIASRQPIQLAVSVSTPLAELIFPFPSERKIIFQFTHSKATKNNLGSIDEFITVLSNQLRIRTRLSKKFPYLRKPAIIIFIDDIFEAIRSANRKTALSFIYLLIDGPEQSIHIIAGSSGIYKPLLNQLIHINPLLKKNTKKPVNTATPDFPVAAELIINPDGLVFFKERNENDFTRLFPAS